MVKRYILSIFIFAFFCISFIPLTGFASLPENFDFNWEESNLVVPTERVSMCGGDEPIKIIITLFILFSVFLFFLGVIIGIFLLALKIISKIKKKPFHVNKVFFIIFISLISISVSLFISVKIMIKFFI